MAGPCASTTGTLAHRAEHPQTPDRGCAQQGSKGRPTDLMQRSSSLPSLNTRRDATSPVNFWDVRKPARVGLKRAIAPWQPVVRLAQNRSASCSNPCTA